MQRISLRFYFDYVSPNAYLAWTQLPRLIATHDVEIEPIPVLFAALLDTCGQKGPAEIPFAKKTSRPGQAYVPVLGAPETNKRPVQ